LWPLPASSLQHRTLPSCRDNPAARSKMVSNEMRMHNLKIRILKDSSDDSYAKCWHICQNQGNEAMGSGEVVEPERSIATFVKHLFSHQCFTSFPRIIPTSTVENMFCKVLGLNRDPAFLQHTFTNLLWLPLATLMKLNTFKRN
jgi:hypothetical protein